MNLLDLPPEVRNRIYHFLLVASHPLYPKVIETFRSVQAHEKTDTPYGPENTLALARACDQLCSESLAIYYGDNTFIFNNTYDLYVYLYMIGDERRGYIFFQYEGERQREAFELLNECTSLLHLHIAVSSRTTIGTRQPQHDLFKARGMTALRKLERFGSIDLQIREVIVPVDRSPWVPKPESARHFTEEHILEVIGVLKAGPVRDKTVLPARSTDKVI